MTPREILSYFGELKGYPSSKIKQRVEEVVEMVEMSDWIDVKIGKFSKGMRQKIGVISADTVAYNILIQSLFHFQNIDFIYELTRNEYVVRIDTLFMRIVMSLLFDSDKIAGIEFFRDINYYLYIGSFEDLKAAERHIKNLEEISQNSPSVKIFMMTIETAEKLPLDVKKYLYKEARSRKNLTLMISIGDVFRTLDNSVFMILNDILKIRSLIDF